MPSSSPITRRTLLAAAALSPLARARAAETFPGGRAVTIIVPFPPGGGVDIVVRGVAERMGRELSVPVWSRTSPAAPPSSPPTSSADPSPTATRTATRAPS